MRGAWGLGLQDGDEGAFSEASSVETGFSLLWLRVPSKWPVAAAKMSSSARSSVSAVGRGEWV